jgi:hypothetical protein
MTVPALFEEVQVRLVAHTQLMGAVANIDGCGIYFVAVAKADAVEDTPEHHRYRVGGAIAKASIHHLLIIGILQSRTDIGPIDHSIEAPEYSRMYR